MRRSPSGQPALLRNLIVAAAGETVPYKPGAAAPAAGKPVLYNNLGSLSFKATQQPQAQAWFNQGMRLAFAFNHAEAQRAFREAQALDPKCALCYWGEALILGPNINVPMVPEANAPALEALAKAVERAPSASPRDQALIQALSKRYSADPKAERPALDAAYADAMKQVAASYPERRHGAGALGRVDDGHAAVGLLGGGRHEAQGPRCRDRRHARNGAEAQPEPSGSDAPVHPCGRGVDAAAEGAGLRRPARARRCRVPDTSCTCRRTSITASACTASRSR